MKLARIWSAAIAVLIVPMAATTVSHGPVSADTEPVIGYPVGYRGWAHVKSALLSPRHGSFAELGGFHHVYANSQALHGYRTRQFPESSIIVFDWLRMSDNAAVFEEGARRRIDVMVKDSRRFAATGGWGFERCEGDSKTERAAAPPRDACFSCHREACERRPGAQQTSELMPRRRAGTANI